MHRSPVRRSRRSSPFVASLVALGLLFPGTTGGFYASPARSVPTVDISVEERSFFDPSFDSGFFFYGLAVCNNGPDVVDSVTFTNPIPEGTVFGALQAKTSALEDIDIPCVTPQPGEQGTISCTLGPINPNDWIFVNLYLKVTAEPGTLVTNIASAESPTSYDPVPENNSLAVGHGVPYPPVLYSIRSVTTSGRYRLRIHAGNMDDNAAFPEYPLVYIGVGEPPWPLRRRKDLFHLFLTGGSDLRARFPKGVPVPLRIVNRDGGYIATTVTR